ncbi:MULTISPECIES: CopG family ribbon-helix-helix protein [Acidiphilium]|jgi:predicted transcriptional regulator|uniref:Predicted transcriptional regulator n=1 Tax=Acidiphilium rubrum TaxID=526 RepID=A0A8G2FF78_ACIRU|nr:MULTISPECIES: ribbon-helix-helix protein, CopG family [Acidiphilium]MCW8309496.1 ribbon-helix-helix protein, CopG family [Acidiphilium sp. PA]SIR55500.1 Predicted transcriptional regulator [Acidiphilium rubrum]HQT89652.1 ribbon-helix-helix protein, CopG family [Acidiphilium sp.]
METRVLTAHVPLPLAVKVDELASRMERSRGWIFKQALAAWIDADEMKSTLTLEAMADVAAGRVVTGDAVQAWVDTLGGPAVSIAAFEICAHRCSQDKALIAV